jgi:hypothetical protein
MFDAFFFCFGARKLSSFLFSCIFVKIILSCYA